MKKIAFLTILFLVVKLQVFSQSYEGELIETKIKSLSVKENLFNEDTLQEVAIYLPPTYNLNKSKKYPVLYFLPGYYDKVSTWTQTGEFQGFKLKSNLDKLIIEGFIKELIVVIPNSYNFFEGTFNTNSSLIGNWEDFITKEVVEYVDNNYRVINSSEGRAIAGHSMGGSGALDLAMKHPDIYCMGYGLCSGLFADNWVDESPLFSNKDQIWRFIELEDVLATMSKESAHAYYVDKMTKVGWLERFMYAYGSAYAGDISIKAPYIQFPYYANGDELMIDDEILELWESGFGKLDEKIITYKDNLLSLKRYVLDYGTKDYFKYIISGNIHYHNLLTEANIPHTFVTHNGDHGSRACQQIENSILPICDSTLSFDTLQLNSNNNVLSFTVDNQVGTTIIDTTNKTITLRVKENVDLSQLQPRITIYPGGRIEPKSRAKVDATQGAISYIVTSENGKNNETWKVHISNSPTGFKNDTNTKKINVYPNPFTNILNIKTANNSTIDKIELYNNDGILVRSFEDAMGNEFNIPTQVLPSGLYTIKILIDGKYYSEKLVR